ncbi:MAG: hypothetical protein FWG10_08185 [Eubacteriaceae bacterium]|nr:hypothetical protein [Eubacteriaceae bacterium]
MANRLKKNLMLAAMLAVFASCLMSCSRQEGVFIVYDSAGSASNPTKKSFAQVRSLETIFKGSVLAYDPPSGIGVITYPYSDSPDGTASYELAMYRNGLIDPLSIEGKQFPAARIEFESSQPIIYFVERNQDLNKSVLNKTTSDGASRTMVGSADLGATIPFVTSSGGVYFINSSNELVYDNGKPTIVMALPAGLSAKRMSLSVKNATILILASVSQANKTNTSLYSIKLADASPQLASIDINVMDFTYSEVLSTAFYAKSSTTGGQDQVYAYNLSTSENSVIFQDMVERISVSPKGNYIAYATRATDLQPAQSIWIYSLGTSLKAQLTTNTRLTGHIFWQNGEDAMIYTENSASIGADSENTTLTYRLNFDIDEEGE